MASTRAGDGGGEQAKGGQQFLDVRRASNPNATPSHSHSVPPPAGYGEQRRPPQSDLSERRGVAEAGLAAANAMGDAGTPVVVLPSGALPEDVIGPLAPGEEVIVMTERGPVLAHRVGQWSDWLFGCFSDPMSCLMALVVPPIRWAITMERARFMSFWRAFCVMGVPWLIYASFYISASLVDDDKTSNILWALAVVFSVFTLMVGFHYRRLLRAEYSIPQQELWDFLLWWVFSCCATAQEARHVDRAEGFLEDGVGPPPVIVVERVPVAYTAGARQQQ